MRPRSVDQALEEAMERRAEGHLAEAETICREVLARHPEHPGALHLLGLLAAQVGRAGLSVELLRKAVAVEPGDAGIRASLGNALQAAGQIPAAIESYQAALRLEPGQPDVHANLGAALCVAGRLEEAIATCREALVLDAAHSAAWNNLGRALHAAGRPGEALDALRQAVRLDPGSPEAHNNLAAALHDTRAFEEAVAGCWEALRLKPDYARAHNNLANSLHALGRYEEAVAASRRALELKGDFAEAFNSLAAALFGLRRLDEAAAACRAALRLRPNYWEALFNLANALRLGGRWEIAAQVYEQALTIAASCGAIEIKPEIAAAAYNHLGICLKAQGRIDRAIASYRRAVALDPHAAPWHSNLVYALHFDPAANPESILAESLLWARRHGRARAEDVPPSENDPVPNRRLRIGYVSPDFCNHVVGNNILPLLKEHDHASFEIFCYSCVRTPDLVTARIRSCADAWREIATLADQPAAELIRADGIDILVDLTMHMGGNRLPLFALKPAPVQVSYLASCNTTGLHEVDYRISDPYIESDESDWNYYTETIFRLPRTTWCYEPCAPMPEVSPLPAARTGLVSFVCRNNFAKVSSTVLDLWAKILRAVPRSRLVLQAPAGAQREAVQRQFEVGNISPDRLFFVTNQEPWDQYAQSYFQADIALDPFPYSGWITSCDALWMGVPVVTVSGTTSLGRGGRSILSNLGLSELVAATPKEYVEIAVALAGDLPRLGALRSGLRERMERSPLRDAAQLARDIESAYREMWSRWCNRTA